MPLAIERAQLGFLTARARSAARAGCRIIGESVTSPTDSSAASEPRMSRTTPQLRLRRRQVRARGDQLLVEVAQLLVVERGAGGLDDVVARS